MGLGDALGCGVVMADLRAAGFLGDLAGLCAAGFLGDLAGLLAGSL